MRFVVAAILVSMAAIVVLAVVFRSKAAWEIIHFSRRIVWLYVLLIVVLAAVEFQRRGGF
ncbi:MAG: hypothetical protein HY875_16475 [Chloroflexi bacterium]|nr:hypothetical protein [Chloroflexota bacterium]